MKPFWFFFLAVIALSACTSHDLRLRSDSLRLNSQELVEKKKEALGGNADAANELYTHYSYVAMDFDEAYHWLRIAADGRNKYAMYNLGRLLLEGKYMEKDSEKGMLLIKRSAEQGLKEAQKFITDRQDIKEIRGGDPAR